MATAKPRHDTTSREAHDRWDKAHLTKIRVLLNNENDLDIIAAIDYLKEQGYKTTDAIRELIRSGGVGDLK